MAPIVCQLFLVAAALLSFARGHGRLADPPSRSTMWRYGFNNPPNYNDMELFCGGISTQWQRNGGKCGICGDAWNDRPRANEAGGKYANRIVVKTYKRGQKIVVSVELTANHNGYFEFRVCPAKNPKVEVTQACLDKHVLRLQDGSGTKYILPKGSGAGTYKIPLHLPNKLTCKRCVFQWIYKTANNWGKCADGSNQIGCGQQEEFRACADIAISGTRRQRDHSLRKRGPVSGPLRPSQYKKPRTLNVQPEDGLSYMANSYHSDSSGRVNQKVHRRQDEWEEEGGEVPEPEPEPEPIPPEPAPILPVPAPSESCEAVGVWVSVPSMKQWCQVNCNHNPPFCPPSHCSC